jgi:hypothetical protein
MRLKLITELSNNIQVKESDSGKLYIEGIFSSAEIMNNNGRKYKKGVLSREVDKIMEKVSNKCLWGELGHPPTPEVNPDKIAILIEGLTWVGENDLEGRAKVLDTDSGRNAKVLIREGNLGISSRGLGTVNEVDSYVNEDFNLITWDLVTDPSNHPSWVKGVYEGQEFETFIPKEKVIVEPEPSIDIDEAKRIYTRHIWQVLENIERSL